jgi:subtilase family serine protease
VIIQQNPEIQTSLQLLGTSCSGSRLDLSVSGGSGNYQYSWNTGARTQDINLPDTGLYVVTVTDGAGCTKTDSINVNQLLVIRLSTTVTNVFCRGASTGAIDLSVTGGTAPYSYQWNNGKLTEDLANVIAGFYSVTVIDSNGCSNTTSVRIQDGALISLGGNQVNPSCFGTSDGSINLTVFGGATPYTFNWSNGATTEDLSGLREGRYTVTVLDLNGCQQTRTFNLDDPDPIVIQLQATDSCGTGAATALASGGNGFFSYTWSNGRSGRFLQNVPLGFYTVYARDTRGCSDSASIFVNVVPQPQAPTISLSNDTICPGDTVALTANGAAGTYRWNNGETGRTILVQQSGFYNVTLTDTFNCVATSSTQRITQLPSVSIQPAGSTNLCVGDVLTLSAGPGNSFVWSNRQRGSSITIVAFFPGTYSYSVTATNDFGCVTRDTIEVTIVPAVTPGAVSNMFPPDSANGVPLPLTFSWAPAANATSYDLFLWESSQTKPTNPVASNLSGLNYTYRGVLQFGRSYNWQVIAKNNCFTNNNNPIQLFTVRDLPDLIAQQVQGPASAVSGQTIAADWTVTNQGQGSTGSTRWVDRVILSDDQVLDPTDRQLGLVPNQSALLPGASYTNSVTFNLPDCILGNYYVFVETDFQNSVLESNNRNNTDSTNAPVLVNLSDKPDLQVDSVKANPVAAFSGDQITASWWVRNYGPGSTQANRWADELYIDQVDTFNINSAIRIGTYYHTGALDTTSANNSYQQTASFNLPLSADSTWYVYVLTDVFDNVNECSVNDFKERNNSNRSDSITVTFRSPADLLVTQVSCIDTASNGQQVTIGHTVRNLGFDSTRANRWFDDIYLTNRPDSNLRNAFRVGRHTHNGALALGASYSATTTVTIPGTFQGTAYFYVVTDVQNDVYEGTGGENNNLGRCPQTATIVEPDLVAQNIQLPSADSTGLPWTLSWEVLNQGPGDAPRSFSDIGYLSRDLILDPSDIALGSLGNGPVLVRGASASRSLTVSSPSSAFGSYYVIVQTDFGNRIFEGNNELNNISASLGTIDIRRPDLIPNNLQGPASALTGSRIAVGWELRNAGSSNINNQRFNEKLYISANPVFSLANSTQIGLSTLSASLLKGDTLMRNVLVSLPAVPTGTYYLHLLTDASNDINEGNGETNNITSSGPVVISLAPFADLQVTAIRFADDTVRPGQQVLVEIDVENKGTATAGGAVWRDVLSITDDTLTGSLRLLGNRSCSRSLEVDSSYTLQFNVSIPGNIQGGQHFYCVTTDETNQIFEYLFENNNILKSDSLWVEVPAPQPSDLRLDSLQSDSVANSGATVAVSWQATHLGPAPTAGFWYDEAYLSTDSILDAGDRFLGREAVFGPISTGQVYEKSRSYTLPNGISGQYYIILFADEDNRNGDSDRSNNVLAQPLRIIQTPAPDLAAIALTAPPTATSGQPIGLRYQAENIGQGVAAGPWVDQFYLSNDPVLDPSDRYLGGKTRNASLAVGQSYSDSVQLFMPANVSGNWFVIFATDGQNNVYEQNREQNNTELAVILVNQPPPSDLIARMVTMPDSAELGDTICVNWVIENIGQNPARGFMREVVVLSKDTVWDIGDVILKDTSININLIQGDSLQRGICAEVPATAIGYYHVIVRTDVLNNIVELVETNNDTASTDSIYLDVPLLPIGPPPTPDILVDNKGLFYRIEVPQNLENQTMQVSMLGDSLFGQNELYGRENDIPDRVNWDFSQQNPFLGEQSILIPNLKAGDYYIFGIGDNTQGNQQAVDLLAEILPFQIISVNANQGGNTGGVTVSIRGGQFSPGMQVMLYDSVLGSITGSIARYVDQSSLFASFNLVGAALGRYDVMLIKTTGDTALLADGFTVVQGPAGGSGPLVGNGNCAIPASVVGQLLQVNVQHPPATRPNRIVAMRVEFENTGNIDLPVPSRFVLSLDGAPLSRDVPGLDDGHTRLYLELREPNGPPNVLRPAARGSIVIYTKAIANLRFRLIE